MKLNTKRIFYVLLSSFTLLISLSAYIVFNNKKNIKLIQNDNYELTKARLKIDDDPIKTIDNEIIEEQEAATLNTNTKEEKEKYIVDYFNKVEEKINQIAESETASNIKRKSKEYVVTLVDFLFYDGTIHDITYDELSEETKTKLLEITGRIDDKIETKVPGYKETIKDKSGNAITYLKDKLNISKDYVENKIEDKIGTETYENIKEEVIEKKDTVKEKTKEVISKSKDKLKNWYENWR